MQEAIQPLEARKTGRFFFRSIAEARFFHLFCGGGEAVGAGIVHGDKAECLGEWNPIGAGLEKFDLGVDPSENGIKRNVADGSVWNGALGKDGRTTGKGEALNYADEADSVHGKHCALAVGNTNARCAGAPARFF